MTNSKAQSSGKEKNQLNRLYLRLILEKINMDVVLYKTDGTKSKIKVNTFVEARAMVCNYDPNGLAEVVKLNDGSMLLIDEEGKNKNYPINNKATELAHLNEAILPSDYIVGDVLLFDDENYFDDLSYE